MTEEHIARAPRALLLLVSCAGLACDQLKSLPGVQPVSVARAAEPAISMGPWLLEEGKGTLVVSWATAAPSVGRVFYGQHDADRLAQEPDARLDHRVPLQNLAPQTRYVYRVDGAVPATGSFTTAPAADAQAPFRVLIYGDNRTNSGDHALVVRAAAAERAQVALHTGDMVVNANEAPLWKQWFVEESDLLSRTPLIPTVGNHEITDKGAAYSRYFQSAGVPPYRSVDYGPLHIVALDSFEEAAGAAPHAGAISDAQAAWFEADLQSVSKDRHVWVLVHQGPFAHPARQRPGHGGSERVKQVLAAGAKRHAIEAVFAGHEHFYERGEIDGTHYFVVGGGGAPLEDPDPTFPGVQSAHKALSFLVVDVCGCHASGKAKDIEGRVLDSFALGGCAVACPATVAAKPVAGAVPADVAAPAGHASAITESAALPELELPALAPAASAADAGPAAETGHRRRRSRRHEEDAGVDAGAAAPKATAEAPASPPPAAEPVAAAPGQPKAAAAQAPAAADDDPTMPAPAAPAPLKPEAPQAPAPDPAPAAEAPK